MSYALRHLQITSQAIAECCTHDDGSKLNKSRKRILSKEILSKLHNLSLKNPKVIVVHPSNGALKELFDCMDEDKIQLPENTTFVLKLSGTTLKKVDHLRLNIYEQLDIILDQLQSDLTKFDGSALSLAEQTFVEAQFKEHILDALKKRPQILHIQATNDDLSSFFKLLTDLKILFPADTEYTLHRNGDCHKRTPTATTCLYQHKISREEIYNKRGFSHKGQLEKLSKQLESLELSAESSDEELEEPSAPMVGWAYKQRDTKVAPLKQSKQEKTTLRI